MSFYFFWHKLKNQFHEWNQNTTTSGGPTQTKGKSRNNIDMGLDLPGDHTKLLRVIIRPLTPLCWIEYNNNILVSHVQGLSRSERVHFHSILSYFRKASQMVWCVFSMDHCKSLNFTRVSFRVNKKQHWKMLLEWILHLHKWCIICIKTSNLFTVATTNSCMDLPSLLSTVQIFFLQRGGLREVLYSHTCIICVKRKIFNTL